MNPSVDSTVISTALIFLIPVVGTIAIFTLLAVVGWAKERRREREAFYRHETARKLVEQGAMNADQFERFVAGEAQAPLRQRRESLKLAGLVLVAAGAGLVVCFTRLEPEAQLVGLVPLLIGVALLLYAFLLAPKPRT